MRKTENLLNLLLFYIRFATCSSSKISGLSFVSDEDMLRLGKILFIDDFAAVLTNREAIIGQLYLTIFVARLMGLYIVGEREAT